MPPLPSELKLLLDSLIAQIQQQQARSDAMSAYVQGELDKVRQGTDIDALKNTQSVQEERIRHMSEEINELKKDLKEAKQEIIKSQRESLTRLIAIQTTVLVILGGGIFGLVELLIHH